MAERIEALPKRTVGRAKKYNFEPYFDGEPWVLIRGTKEEVKESKADFDCTLKSIRATLYREAKEAGFSVNSRFTEHNGREAIAFSVEKSNGSKRQRKQTDKTSA